MLLRQRGPLRPPPFQAQDPPATTAPQQQRSPAEAQRQLAQALGQEPGLEQRRHSPDAPPGPRASALQTQPHQLRRESPAQPAAPALRQPPFRCPGERCGDPPSRPARASSPRARSGQAQPSERAARRPPAPGTVLPLKTTKRSAQDRRLPNKSQLSRRGWCAGRARGRRRGPPRSAARAPAAPRAGSPPFAKCSPPSACRRGR